MKRQFSTTNHSNAQQRFIGKTSKCLAAECCRLLLKVCHECARSVPRIGPDDCTPLRARGGEAYRRHVGWSFPLARSRHRFQPSRRDFSARSLPSGVFAPVLLPPCQRHLKLPFLHLNTSRRTLHGSPRRLRAPQMPKGNMFFIGVPAIATSLSLVLGALRESLQSSKSSH